MAGEFERLRGRHVERWSGHDVEALETRFRAGGVDEVVLVGHIAGDELAGYVGACAEAGVPVMLPVPLQPQALPLPPPDVETVGSSDYVVYQPRKLEAGVLVAKAIADRLLAALLIILFSPIMTPSAAALGSACSGNRTPKFPGPTPDSGWSRYTASVRRHRPSRVRATGDAGSSASSTTRDPAS